MTTTFAQVPLAHIVTSRTNPRKWFDPAKLSELAESIKATGVTGPRQNPASARVAARFDIPKSRQTGPAFAGLAAA